MIYNVTARFENTETARAAAEKIRSAMGTSTEIRMCWKTSENGVKTETDVRYSPLHMPQEVDNASHFETDSSSPEWGSGFSNLLLPGFSDECALRVRANNRKDAYAAKSTMINGGGFDVNVKKNDQT